MVIRLRDRVRAWWQVLPMGTKSVLIGAHCFFLHPWFVAFGWWRLYGFPWDPRLWVSFIVHDLGYVGKSQMDDADGETHPILGARIMTLLFDKEPEADLAAGKWKPGHVWVADEPFGKWGQFSLLHSRFYAKRVGLPISKLCAADKLAFSLTPRWLYLPMVNFTGEIREYMNLAHVMNGGAGGGKYADLHASSTDQIQWHSDVKAYMAKWLEDYLKNGADIVTVTRSAKTDSGVY